MKWIYFLLSILGYFFIMLFPEFEGVKIITSIRKIVWQMDFQSFVIFHLIIGLLFYFIFDLKPKVLNVFLVSLIPVLGFCIYFLYYYFLDDIYKGQEHGEAMAISLMIMFQALIVTSGGGLIGVLSGWVFTLSRNE